MPSYSTIGINHKLTVAMQVHQLLCATKKSLSAGKAGIASWLIKASLFLVFALPLTAQSQEAGCISADTIYVTINTVPPTINATPASFSCGGSYTYQWLVSTDNINYTVVPGATGQNLNYTLPVSVTLFFLRQAKCGGITMYTNRVVVYPVYTACEDFGLSLAGTAGNAVATIKAGMITTTTSSTIGEFVIEWYREVIDDNPEFVSGSAGATDPAVTVSHPFSGEPAEGGNWHPVIKYIYIDGIKYSRKYLVDARHSPDLLNCLDTIIVIVDNLTCANGGTVITNGLSFAHRVTYTNGLVSPTLASRSLRFDLDATNKYFAWKFEGYLVADNFQITYVSPANGTSTILENWKIGGDAGGNNVTISPKTWSASYLHKIISLNQFVFAAGDYLRINITPGANSNTNWDFYCKCFASVNCDIWDSGVRSIQPGTVAMTWNSSLCQYEITYNRTTWTNPPGSNFLSYHYNTYFLDGGAMGGYEPTSSQVKVILRKSTSAFFIQTAATSNCAAQSGSSTVSKTGNVVTAAYSNVNDYNYQKSSYQAALTNPGMTSYSPNNTLLEHYKFFAFHFVVANSCGDTRVDRFFYTHYSNPPVFNDAAMTITINLASVSNNYSPINSCDNTFGTVASLISSTNAGINVADFSSATNVRGNPFMGIYLGRTTTDETAIPKIFTAAAKVPGIDMCDLSVKSWSATKGLNAFQWHFDLIWDKVTITNAADPINNFRLERLMDNNGNPLQPGSYIKVYEIINGVVQ